MGCRLVLSGTEMKEVDTQTIAKIGIPSMVLMERAAMAVAQEIMKNFERNQSVLIISGSGNNGADGIAVARILSQNDYDVSVEIIGNMNNATDEMKRQVLIAEEINVKFVKEAGYDEYDILVDAIFGIGLSRKIEGHYAEVIQRINCSKAEVVSIDIPSGIDSANGEVMGIAVKADITVTFGTYKRGLLMYPGAEYAGKLIVDNAGFPKESLYFKERSCFAIENDILESLIPERYNDSNKGSYGKLLIIAGSKNMSGAACLCARAAYRSGVGLVKVFTSEENRVIIQSVLPEAVLMTYDNTHINMELLKNEIAKSTFVVCGPGIGVSPLSENIVKCVLESGKNALLDADALNVISEFNNLTKYYHKGIVITPHIGEFSRLTGSSIAEIKKDAIEKCRDYAVRNNIVCVLKDSRTVISSEGGKCYINMSGNSGMSTAGSGDVLAGIISSLACQKMKVLNAAIAGVYIHGLAGDYAAENKSKYSMIAGDIVEELSTVFSEAEWRQK